MAKLMCSVSGGVNPPTLEAVLNNRSNATCGSEAANRSLGAQKNPAAGAVWSTMPQIRCDRLANVGGYRHLTALPTLAAHAQSPHTPINIVQFKRHHFT